MGHNNNSFLAEGQMLEEVGEYKGDALIQIIHTNDLHSMFTGIQNRGGYARVKEVIDHLFEEGNKQGISSLILDGGDFSEGSSFFLVDKGVDTFKALDILGYDAAVLGNHDHMMGEEVLVYQFKEAQLSTKIVSANAVFAGQSEAAKLVHPFTVLRKKGLKIFIVGFSTPELYYQYPLKPGYILPELLTAGYYERVAREEGADIIVALTHLGVDADRRLVRNTSEIDLVVGGHSHTFLEKPKYIKNKAGRSVPVLQAGAHGFAVGSLIINVRKPGDIKVIDYKLHYVDSSISESPGMAAFVNKAVERRNGYFEGRWNEHVGYSKIKLYGYNNDGFSQDKYWVNHQASMVKDAARTDVGLHLGNFNGIMISPGEITYGNIVDNMPHVRNFGDPGWRIARFTLEGWKLYIILKALVNFSNELSFKFDGLHWRELKIPEWVPLIGGRFLIWGLEVNNQRLQSEKQYLLGFPAEIAYAIRELLPSSEKMLLPEFEEFDKYYWPLMKDYIRINSPLT